MKFKTLPIQTALLAILVAAVITFFIGLKLGSSKSTAAADQQVSAPQAYAKEMLNKDYSFPIKDSNGKVVTNIKYTVQDAQLMNSILIKGQNWDAVKGKTFLVLDLKLINSSDQTINFPSRNYIRLSVNNTPDLLAAEFHSDPLEIDPISTINTRLGFSIDSKYKSLTLQIGEVGGTKDIVKLHLK